MVGRLCPLVVDHTVVGDRELLAEVLELTPSGYRHPQRNNSRAAGGSNAEGPT